MEKALGNLDQRKYVMLNGEMFNNVDTSQGVAQGCTLSPKLIKAPVYITDMIVAVEASKQVALEDVVPGLMFAGDFVGMSETPEGLQKQLGKTVEYTRKWRVRERQPT